MSPRSIRPYMIAGFLIAAIMGSASPGLAQMTYYTYGDIWADSSGSTIWGFIDYAPEQCPAETEMFGSNLWSPGRYAYSPGQSVGLSFNDEEGDWSFYGDVTVYCHCGGHYMYFAASVSASPISFFRAIFKKDHYNSFIEKWVYRRQDALCTGACQPFQLCSTSEAEWLYVFGLRLDLYPGGGYCQPIPPFPRSSQTAPACIQQFGQVIGGWNDDCS